MLLNAFVSYATLALGGGIFVILSVTTRRELRKALLRTQEVRDSADTAVQNVSSALAQLREEVSSLKEAPRRTPTPANSLSLTKRTKALRMHGRGESAESIAAALRVPRNQIDLLLKVQRLLKQA